MRCCQTDQGSAASLGSALACHQFFLNMLYVFYKYHFASTSLARPNSVAWYLNHLSQQEARMLSHPVVWQAVVRACQREYLHATIGHLVLF